MKEVEIKALLTEERYRYLKGLLPARFRKINDDNITTIKFQPHDVRVRYSGRKREVIFKSRGDDAAAISRDEISIPLQTQEDCDKMVALLDAVGLSQHPSWTTEKQEFICEMAGNQYTLSLQNIPNFAYILEAEAITDNPAQHIPHLKRLIESLGCTPIEPEDFRQKVDEYRQKYKGDR